MLEGTDAADAKPELLDFLAAAPDAENDPYADQPTKTAPELPELTPAQQLAGYIRSRSAAALVTAHAQLASEVENADELLAQMPQDPQCEDIVSRTGAKDTYYYSSANMSDNYAMLLQQQLQAQRLDGALLLVDLRVQGAHLGGQGGVSLRQGLGGQGDDLLAQGAHLDELPVQQRQLLVKLSSHYPNLPVM